jgi:hypothetical protein
MRIKHANTLKSQLSTIDLLGDDEVALAKAFAYVLACEQQAYFAFLRLLQIPCRDSSVHYRNLEVTIEKKRSEGRTDIELRVPKRLHVIIECKIQSGKITKQRTQYVNSFDADAPMKVMCYVTQERGSRFDLDEDVCFKHISWEDIIELLNTPRFAVRPLMKEFLSFAQRNYKVRYMKEILIQDLSIPLEIKRFREYNVYRRDQSFIAPIYFAPYFTRNNEAKEREGISCLSRVLGVLTINPTQFQSVDDDLSSFTDDTALIDRWRKGIRMGNTPNALQTYFFLDYPVVFATPLLKSHRRNSENWIASSVPKNRCVRFVDFIRHIPQLRGQLSPTEDDLHR